MSQATVVSIYLAEHHGADPSAVDEVSAKSEQGLIGDRHFIASADKAKPSDRQLTLIESEEIERFNDSQDAPFEPGEYRRQIVTSGVRLNELVDREFLIGEVRMRGTMLCEPCKHLADLTCRQILWGLVGRGGLCAQILTSGTIRRDDTIQVASEQT